MEFTFYEAKPIEYSQQFLEFIDGISLCYSLEFHINLYLIKAILSGIYFWWNRFLVIFNFLKLDSIMISILKVKHIILVAQLQLSKNSRMKNKVCFNLFAMGLNAYFVSVADDEFFICQMPSDIQFMVNRSICSGATFAFHSNRRDSFCTGFLFVA